MKKMMASHNPATSFSEGLVFALLNQGVTDFVVCPGSRSQSLALAVEKFASLGKAKLHVRIDERSAAFLSLGIGLETGRPAPIITTSGTAVLNLHPALLEAHHAGVPMLALTADRPAQLHGLGTSQTTQQTDIFRSLLRAEWSIPPVEDWLDFAELSNLNRASFLLAKSALEIAQGTTSAGPGPVQLNLEFREPLSGPSAFEPTVFEKSVAAGEFVGQLAKDKPLAPSYVLDRLRDLPASLDVTAAAGTVIFAGSGAGAKAVEIAAGLGAPLIAEVVSNARFGPNLMPNYRHLLAIPKLRQSIRRVIVCGRPTLSRDATSLLQDTAIEVIVVPANEAEVFNPAGRLLKITDEINSLPAANQAEADAVTEWFNLWLKASRQLTIELDQSAPAPDLALSRNPNYKAKHEFVTKELQIAKQPVTRQTLVNAVWQASWPHDRLVLGASQLIRDLDEQARGRKITVHSNRGLAGIDGVVSTAVGVALAQQASTPGITRLLLGDLSFLHDLGGLFFSPLDTKPRIQIIVGNDGGGSIFDHLEVAATADPASFDRVQFTPQQLDLSKLVAGFSLQYRIAKTRSELERALTEAVTGPVVIEVPIGR